MKTIVYPTEGQVPYATVLLKALKDINDNALEAAGTPGTPGREIELQKGAQAIEWRYVGESTWTPLVPLSEITGAAGKSAFEVAVDNGFVGTASAWLATLVGAPGGVGPAPVLTATSQTSTSIGSASRTFALDAPTDFAVNQFVRAAVTASPTNYLAGLVTAVSPTSITILGSESSGTGTFAAWTLSLTGVRGATGTSGTTPSYTGTATSSHAVTTGSKPLATQSGKSWTVGQRVRISLTADPANTWMEGVVTAYATTTLTVLVDLVKGTGTQSAWTIGLAGEPGVAGAAGATTIAGISGLQAELDAKLLRPGNPGAASVLTQNTDGSTTLIQYSQSAGANTIPRRLASGQFVVPTSPANANEATSKQYVDALVAAVPPGMTEAQIRVIVNAVIDERFKVLPAGQVEPDPGTPANAFVFYPRA